MPMDYIFSTIALGLKLGTLLAGAMLFSGGNWVQSLVAGQQLGVDSTGYTVPTHARFMTFWSAITPRGTQDVEPPSAVFVHDRVAGATELVSVAPAISADGRYIAYESAASNLLRGGTPSAWGLYIHDRHTLTTFRARLNIAAPAFTRGGYRRISNLVLLDEGTISLDIDVGAGTRTVRVNVADGDLPPGAVIG